MAKKSFYIFASGLLGMLLFLIVYRILVFIYLYFVISGYLSSGFNYIAFSTVDYFLLIAVLMAGGWYGVWLGMNWFAWVYENKTHGGLADYIAKCYLPKPKKNILEQKMEQVQEEVQQAQEDMAQLEVLSEESPFIPPFPMPRVVEIKTEPLPSEVVSAIKKPRRLVRKKTTVKKTKKAPKVL